MDSKKAGEFISTIGVPLLAGLIGIVGLTATLGTLLVHGAVPSFLTRWDISSSDWAFEHRTPTLDRLTHVGSMLAETATAIAVAAVAVVVFRLWFGRWRESLVIAVAIVGELLTFLLVTVLVHRARPSVPHLDPAPPTSSFPSGHTGAAMALYGCLAVILLRNIKPRWAAVSVNALCFAIPIVVAASRVYRGMHFVSDVLAGALAGGSWLTIVVLVLLPRRSAGGRRRRRTGRQS